MEPNHHPHTASALGAGLHENFARVARVHPDAVALIHGKRSVTYAELDRTADAWAARLQAAGAGAASFIPIRLPRCIDLITALLAVLKTGAAYALIDPAWPARRTEQVLTQLHAPLLITSARSGASEDMSAGLGISSWVPPSGPVAIPAGFRPTAVAGGHPCSVFFTSGTSGRPKGVLTPHQATARLFGPDSFAALSSATVMPLAAPVPWDAFSLELWSVLLNGGTSLIVGDVYLSPAALRIAVHRHGADTVWLTSSLFNMVVDEDPDAFKGLHQVLIGGERLSVAHVRRFLRRHAGIVLLNGYGPVESTVFATTHRITGADCDRPGGIPLGHAVPGTRVYVLDGDQPCAAGRTGEICIAGSGLALCYLGDPGLTRAKFTDVRLDGVVERVYRTGDLGLRDADGLLHFRGRADRQVKIRGHRIEPAEVERQVEELLPAVRQCRVLVRPDGTGVFQELVAFCIPALPGDSLGDAQAVLDSAVVSYQRPAEVVSVDAFPVTPQGKLDERALLALAPCAAPPTPRPSAEPDGDAVLRTVAAIFAAVLGTRSVPLDVPFQGLGGTSLAAGMVCARLAAAFDHPVPVRRLFENPTAHALAGWLRGALASTAPSRPPLEHRTVPGRTPLTAMQVAYLTRNLLAPQDRTSHCLLTWVVEGELDRTALQAAVDAVHQRHESLRTACLLDPVPSALLVDVPAPPLEVLPVQASADAAMRAIRAELAAELDPMAGDVWRVALVPVSGTRTAVLGCVVHHVAFDGRSESVLARDLAAAYAAARGKAPKVPPGPTPSLQELYQERSRYGEHTETAAVETHLRELADAPELLWPDRPQAGTNGAPVQLELHVTAALMREVDARAAALGVTRFAVLLTHWAGALAEVTGQSDFTIGVPVAQHYSARLEHAVGCHIGLLCLRMRGPALAGGPAAVEATAAAVVRAFASQEVPLSELLSRTGPSAPGRPPVYQVLFALQDNPEPVLALPGARTSFVRQPYLDLPLELHAELWPDRDGGLLLLLSFHPETVADDTVHELAKKFADRLHSDLLPRSAP